MSTRGRVWVLAFISVAAGGGALLLAFLITAATAASLGDRLAAASGAATTILALVAGTSAVQNADLIWAARSQARDSRDLVAATARQAAASATQSAATFALVTEAQIDREYEYRPLLTITVGSQGSVDGRPYRHMVVANIGRGPALSAAIATHDFADKGHMFGSTELFDLGPGASRRFEVYDEDGASGQRFRRLIDDLPEPSIAVGFMDVVGNRYRTAITGGSQRIADTRRRGDPASLDWTSWV